MGETPSGLQKQSVPEGKIAQAIGGDAEDDELEARLAGLKK
jgi:charged multivesicular body protein 2A